MAGCAKEKAGRQKNIKTVRINLCILPPFMSILIIYSEYVNSKAVVWLTGSVSQHNEKTYLELSFPAVPGRVFST